MRVKKLGRVNWREFKAMRLETLRQNGQFMTANLRDVESFEDRHWTDLLSSERHALFGLYDAGSLVGITGIFTDKDDQTGRTAILGMSYIQEAYRGRGFSKLLYQARIDWAKAQERFDRIVVGHKEGNEASRRANQAFEFNYTGRETKRWGDGSTGILHIYEMRLT